jgi:hypothetical protein
MEKDYLIFDFGASNGRVAVASFDGIQASLKKYGNISSLGLDIWGAGFGLLDHGKRNSLLSLYICLNYYRITS